MITSLLFALISLQGAAQSAPKGPFPLPAQGGPADDFKSWSGFGYLGAGDRDVPRPFAGAGDWSAVEAASLTPDAADAVPWRLKVVVLRRIDRTETLPDGTLWEEKCVFETPDMERVRRSVLQLQALVKAETDGRVKLVPDISVEDEAILDEGRSISRVVSDYLYPRFNGGAYEGEDHVYRGPYDSVICVQPVAGAKTEQIRVNDTAVGILSGYRGGDYETDGLIALKMASLWTDQVEALARRSGVLGQIRGVRPLRPETGLTNPNLYVPEGDWGSVKLAEDQPASTILAHLKLSVDLSQPNSQGGGKLLLGSYIGSDSQVHLTTDPDRGSVLTYSERGSSRTGGVAFPGYASAAPVLTVSKTPTLVFWAKSSCEDPLGLEFVAPDGHKAYISLGRDWVGGVSIPQANLARDGQWHEVKVDLRATGLDQVSAFFLAPTPNSFDHIKQTFGPVEYSFAGFKATADTPDAMLGPLMPDPDSQNPLARAEWAHAAQNSPKLLALLKDPNWSVRLNAITRYEANPSPDAEPGLTDNAKMAIDGPVSAAAMDALWKLGTDAGKATVSQIVNFGMTEEGKAEAADLLTRSGDATMAPKLIVLNQSRSLRTRIATVRALGKLSGPDAVIIRSTFLFQADPELKVEVTRTLDPNDPSQVKKLLWSAANEPSDAVRAESDIKLIQSKDVEARNEGYKGVKDDSVEVRLILLRYFAAHPSEAHRNAIRVAVIDRSARVRAAALLAFAVLQKAATPDELGAVTDDLHPNVQLALIELSLHGGVKLSPQQASQMKNSPDPDVRESAKRLLP